MYILPNMFGKDTSMYHLQKYILNLVLKLCGKEARIEHTIHWQEMQARKLIFPEIKQHLQYLDRLYDLCFACQNSLDNQTPEEIGVQLVGQIMILMQITDFLRRIRADVVDGYPDQAATLAATVFELAHTAVYFSYTPEAAKKWLAKESSREKMPKLIGINNFSDLVNSNYKHLGKDQFSKYEYYIYTQLCLIKHSHPDMHGLKRLENARVMFKFGPYIDEKSINHAWFSMQHAGRLAEMVIEFSNITQQNDRLTNEFSYVNELRNALDQKAKARFGTKDPFNNDIPQ